MIRYTKDVKPNEGYLQFKTTLIDIQTFLMGEYNNIINFDSGVNEDDNFFYLEYFSQNNKVCSVIGISSPDNTGSIIIDFYNRDNELQFLNEGIGEEGRSMIVY